MARTIRDSNLQTRAARARLRPQRRPYWCTLRPGLLHLGYAKRHHGQPGYWTVRSYGGKVARGSPYIISRLPGTADDYEDSNGESVLSFAQAQDLALARANFARGTPTGPMTVATAMQQYIEYLRTHRQTAQDAEGRIRALVLPQLGDIRLDDLTLEQLERWRDVLVKRPPMTGSKYRDPTTEEAKRARRATVNRMIGMLKAGLNLAFKRTQVSSDHAWRLLARLPDSSAQRPGFLTIQEAKRLINASDEASGFRDLVLGALATGCRYGELTALRVRDFDAERDKIEIRRSKSGRSRVVVLNDEGAMLFRRLAAGRARDERVFRRGDGRPWQRSNQGPPMIAACRRAKIEPPVGFHQLRHTWASHAVMNGMPLIVVSRNLGHRDTKMVERFYGHLTEDYVDKAIKAGAPRFGVGVAGNVRPLRAKQR
jgi:integrase